MQNRFSIGRRSFLAGSAALAGVGVASSSSLLVSCAPPLVRRVESRPIAADPRGGATLIVIDSGRARYGPVFLGSNVLAGACVPLTHFVTVLAPGRHLLVAYDDESYDAGEADLAPYGIYALDVEHSESELEIRPLVPGRDPIRRLLDETDRVELARAPKREDIETFERKVRLAKLRYADYSARKREARAIGPQHAWR